MWLSLLISRMGKGYGQSQAFKQAATERAAAETETVLVQIRLNTSLVQAVIGTQDKCLGVTDYDVQPMERPAAGSIRLVLMDIPLQCWDVTVVAIVVDLTSIGKGSMNKFSYRCLLYIRDYPHFQEAGIAPLIQRQCRENLNLFCAAAPLFANCWTSKVRIIEFDDTAE